MAHSRVAATHAAEALSPQEMDQDDLPVFIVNRRIRVKLRRDIDLDSHLEYLCYHSGVELERRLQEARERGDGNMSAVIDILRATSKLCREAAMTLEHQEHR